MIAMANKKYKSRWSGVVVQLVLFVSLLFVAAITSCWSY